MDIRFEFKGRVYPIIPDSQRAKPDQLPCESCAAVADDDLCAAFSCLAGSPRSYLGPAILPQAPILTPPVLYGHSGEPVQAEQKASNPKEAIGSTRVALATVPDTLAFFVAPAFYEGATKYGSYNWRVAGVRASTYKAAAERHIKKWWNGENTDPKTKVRHLANAIACLAILLDSEACDKLNDDRPPKLDMNALVAECEAVQAHLAEMHKDLNPTHYTEKGLA